ncbi:MAG: hypothetical protein H8E13_08970 [Actinobacteria bacterium]|nr:hypothetical protein [Actinomycetota bacterium]
MLPYKHNKENPFIELYFHYQLNEKNLLSPTSFSNPDPIAEFSEKLKSTGNKEDWKLGRKLQPKMRTYVPIIVRGLESEGVKFWGFGVQLYEELLSIIADPEYGDITDPISGTDLTIERKTAEEAGNNWGSTTIRPKRQQTKLTENAEQLKKWLNEQDSITDIYREPSYDELKEELEKWLNPDDETEEKTESSDSNTSDNIEDVLKDFDKMLED